MSKSRSPHGASYTFLSKIQDIPQQLRVKRKLLPAFAFCEAAVFIGIKHFWTKGVFRAAL
jgi:hypothetical protein